jgi:hypothetical protein
VEGLFIKNGEVEKTKDVFSQVSTSSPAGDFTLVGKELEGWILKFTLPQDIIVELWKREENSEGFLKLLKGLLNNIISFVQDPFKLYSNEFLNKASDFLVCLENYLVKGEGLTQISETNKADITPTLKDAIEAVNSAIKEQKEEVIPALMILLNKGIEEKEKRDFIQKVQGQWSVCDVIKGAAAKICFDDLCSIPKEQIRVFEIIIKQFIENPEQIKTIVVNCVKQMHSQGQEHYKDWAKICIERFKLLIEQKKEQKPEKDTIMEELKRVLENEGVLPDVIKGLGLPLKEEPSSQQVLIDQQPVKLKEEGQPLEKQLPQKPQKVKESPQQDKQLVKKGRESPASTKPSAIVYFFIGGMLILALLLGILGIVFLLFLKNPIAGKIILGLSGILFLWACLIGLAFPPEGLESVSSVKRQMQAPAIDTKTSSALTRDCGFGVYTRNGELDSKAGKKLRRFLKTAKKVTIPSCEVAEDKKAVLGEKVKQKLLENNIFFVDLQESKSEIKNHSPPFILYESSERFLITVTQDSKTYLLLSSLNFCIKTNNQDTLLKILNLKNTNIKEAEKLATTFYGLYLLEKEVGLSVESIARTAGEDLDSISAENVENERYSKYIQNIERNIFRMEELFKQAKKFIEIVLGSPDDEEFDIEEILSRLAEKEKDKVNISLIGFDRLKNGNVSLKLKGIPLVIEDIFLELIEGCA